MATHYLLKPEVPGGLGPDTQLDRSVHPPRVTVLHYLFDGWLGDELVESFPCFLITARLAKVFRQEGVTGYTLEEEGETFQVEVSEQFREIYPDRTLPPFLWMKVSGQAGVDDVFLAEDHRLGVTRKVLDLVLASYPQMLEYEGCDVI